MRRFITANIVCLALWLGSERSAAAQSPGDRPGPHRLSLGVSGDVIAPGINTDANWADFGFGLGIAAGYAYCVLPWLEVGAQAAFWTTGEKVPDVFIPALAVRAFIPLNMEASSELGFTGRAGLLTELIRVPNYRKTWNGSAFTAAVDWRTWVSRRAAFQASLELTRGSAHSTRDDFYSQRDTTYTALGIWARVIFAP